MICSINNNKVKKVIPSSLLGQKLRNLNTYNPK